MYTYVEKFCFENTPRGCSSAWQIETAFQKRLNYSGTVDYDTALVNATSSLECYEKCATFKKFNCRSATWEKKMLKCTLSAHNRATLAGIANLIPNADATYFENLCAPVVKKKCTFEPIIPKRVVSYIDSIKLKVGNVEECRFLCLNAAYPCRSFSYLPDKSACLLSHHSSSTVNQKLAYKLTNLTNVETFELVACYDVELTCQSDRLLVDVITSRIFNGKVYLKDHEDTCMKNIDSSFAFNFEINYETGSCKAKKLDHGLYLIDLVIQYYDNVVTVNDIWLSTTCKYDMTDKTLINDYDLGVYDIKQTDYDDFIAGSGSNIELSIVHPNGSYIEETAQVGDYLSVKLEPINSPASFDFVLKKLSALDPDTNNEIVLLENGCPVLPYLVSNVYKVGQTLRVDFKTFKYSKSDYVRFVATVGSCMKSCAPVRCGSEEDSDVFADEIDFGRDLQQRVVQSKPIQMGTRSVLKKISNVRERFK